MTANQTGCMSGPAMGHNLCLFWGSELYPHVILGRVKPFPNIFLLLETCRSRCCSQSAPNTSITLQQGADRGSHPALALSRAPSVGIIPTGESLHLRFQYSTCNPIQEKMLYVNLLTHWGDWGGEQAMRTLKRLRVNLCAYLHGSRFSRMC